MLKAPGLHGWSYSVYIPQPPTTKARRRPGFVSNKSTMSLQRPLAIIAGVGPGTGSSVALRFSEAYTVVALARTPKNYDGIVNAIRERGGEAIGVQADVTDQGSIDAAFDAIHEAYPRVSTATAIYNVSSFVKKPFLELELQDFETGWATGVKGAFLFSKKTIPLLKKTAAAQATSADGYPPTLIFTGATAALKANPGFAGFATGKWGARALSQSLAKEFGPQGVHVAHAVIDGVIDVPAAKDWVKGVLDGKIAPKAIADVYWHLHTQPKTAFTWEIDIRPAVEKW